MSTFRVANSRDSTVTRRDFVLLGVMAVAWRPLRFWRTRLGDVTLVEFADNGERKGLVHLPKVSKSRDEWQKQLSPLAYRVAREGETERPFTGAYWDLHEGGLFRCICCDTALFSSAAKFDAGTGWPSFWQPVAEENVHHGTPSHGYTNSDVTCRRCDAHLGDLFDDGPKPTGLRYCIDSVALRFVKFA